jgi:predicted NBD/HSP70 family sugar kinase
MSPDGGPVRQRSLRRHNLALILRQVVTADRTPSRADLAAATGLTRATVSALVDELLRGGLLTEVAPARRTGAGRPAVGLAPAAAGPAGLGLEINVDYLAACVLDLTGAVRHRAVHRVDLRAVPAAEALALLGALAGTAVAEAGRRGLTPTGAALAVPGLVDSDGVVLRAPNLGWRDVDARALLGDHPAVAGRPLVVDNEANLAALGELHTDPTGGASFLYVSGEVGVGAGIVLRGSLFRGGRGFAGELGHVPVYPDGRACRCGATGCLEPYAGQEAILAAAGLADPPPPADPAWAGPGRATTRPPDGPEHGVGGIDRLAALAGAGEPAAVAALAGAGRALGVAVAGVVNLLDVQTVVLGGGYAPLARWLGPPVEAEVRRRVLTAAWAPVTVRPARLGGDAAVVGAAGSVVRAVLADPTAWLDRAPSAGAALDRPARG